MSYNELLEVTFEPTYALEILLFTAIGIFFILLLGLGMLLYAPRLRKMAFRYRGLSSVDQSRSRSSSTADSDLESFYIPGQYAQKLKFKTEKNLKPPMTSSMGSSRQDHMINPINSTYRDDVEPVSLNRYFPGLKELSRISAMTPDDLMVKLQSDYETYAKMRQKIQARQNRKVENQKSKFSKIEKRPEKLRSILKKSTSDSSTLNPSFSRPRSEHLSYVV